MKQVIGFRDPRLIGLRVKPRWMASTTTVSLVANGGMGQVIFSIPLITIETRDDLEQAIARVSSANHSVADFLEALNRGFLLRHGKSVEAYLQGRSDA